MKIESESLTINANDYTGIWMNQAGNVMIGTDENVMEKLVINNTGVDDDSSTNTIYSSGNSIATIVAKEVELTSAEKGILVNRGNVYIGTEKNKADKITIISKESTLYGKDSTTESQKSVLSLLAKDIYLENTTGGLAIDGVKGGNGTEITVTADEKLDIKGGISVADTNSVISINKDKTDALVTIDGDITADAGTINLNLGTTGSTLTSTITDNANGVNLNLNKGTWNVTGASTVGTVSGDGATIKVDSLQEDYVKVGNGSNASHFTLLGGRNVTDQLDGDNLEGSMKDIVSIVDGITFASYEFEEGTALGAIEAYQENGVWKITERTNVTNSNISDVAALGLMAWRAENNDMNKRLGELRNANGEHGVWVRMVRGETEYEAVKNQYNTYQLGYDEKLSVDKSWTVGMALTYTDGESSFNGGNGENKHKGLAIYGSKLNNDGTFVDLIAKYARLDHDVEVGTEKGDYEANGYSVSAEYGKRFQQGNGLWVEPQVELTYGKVGSADYMIGKNRAVTHEGMESLVGRVGFSLGKDIKQGNLYARASYLYDFEGETEASYTDAIGNVRNINDDLGGGWWEVGVGANINLSKATYIYADVEKTFGGEVDTNWQWNLGVRYSF